MGYLQECREFFDQFCRQNRNTGAVLPSSRFLARALTRPLARASGPRRILEVGPGTGAVTAEIVKQLRPGDWLDIVEINDQFVAIIEKRFSEEPDFKKCREQAKVIHAPLQDVPGEAVYDFLISGLPLNNFPLSLVRDVFTSYQRLLKPDGILSYFEYLGIRRLKMPFVSRKERRRLQVLNRFLARRIQRHQIGAEKVLMNMPPAVARHFCFTHAAG